MTSFQSSKKEEDKVPSTVKPRVKGEYQALLNAIVNDDVHPDSRDGRLGW